MPAIWDEGLVRADIRGLGQREGRYSQVERPHEALAAERLERGALGQVAQGRAVTHPLIEYLLVLCDFAVEGIRVPKPAIAVDLAAPINVLRKAARGCPFL